MYLVKDIQDIIMMYVPYIGIMKHKQNLNKNLKQIFKYIHPFYISIENKIMLDSIFFILGLPVPMQHNDFPIFVRNYFSKMMCVGHNLGKTKYYGACELVDNIKHINELSKCKLREHSRMSDDFYAKCKKIVSDTAFTKYTDSNYTVKIAKRYKESFAPTYEGYIPANNVGLGLIINRLQREE